MIKGKSITFVIKTKVSDLSNIEALELYSYVRAFYDSEKKRGNEYVKADLVFNYDTNLSEVEYINIFKYVRTPVFYDFLYYLLNFKKKYNEQSIDTKININDYVTGEESVSQKIVILMMFAIKTEWVDLEKRKNEIFAYYANDELLEEYLNKLRD